jgi:CcmD family protein
MNKKTRRILLIIGVAAMALMGGVADASEAAQQTPSGESNLPFLFAAFAVTWAAFVAYLFYLSRRQLDLRKEIEELRQDLHKKDSDARARTKSPAPEE